MNTTVVSALIAKLTAGCGLVLLLPLLTALFGEEPVLPFIYSMALCFLLAAFLRYKGKKKVINLNPRDGLAVTALSWICISILYLFPYFLSGLLSPLDALVESISGLTGTGATVFFRFNRSAEKHSFLPLPDPLARRPGNHRHLCGALPAGRKRKRPHD